MFIEQHRSIHSFPEPPLLLLLLTSSSCLIITQIDLPSASLPMKWLNSANAKGSVVYPDGTIVRLILHRQDLMFGDIATGQDYACGFYCNGTCHISMFAIFFFQQSSSPWVAPQVVWSANRESPVKINSTLELTSDGDLVLKNSDGIIAWSTNTSEVGNLLLLDEHNRTVWQSFDHPTDSLLPRQILLAGQKLTASISSTNWTDLGYLSLTLTRSGLLGLIETDLPRIYYQHNFTHNFSSNDTVYVEYGFGGLSLFLSSEYDMTVIVITDSILTWFLKLGSDGHLRLYEWYNDSLTWDQGDDLLTRDDLGECGYPMACGEYGICTNNGQCSCPGPADGPNYFRQIDVRIQILVVMKLLLCLARTCSVRGFLNSGMSVTSP
ncbi:hypothetical protein CRG98_035613 [Punica granatum]|uniref:Bulb-type lectin domain-containing protein n=1 Tax=Punica granatum TaxID=22663 RepID=A0A2I0IJ38_PUNGR|nr:hypothetical protein CRG98_035613 [Punica granatum]